MTSERPRLLMATHYDWDGPLMLGSNHLARGFAQAGWEVARVATAISLPQLLGDPAAFRARAAKYRRRGVSHVDGHLWTYTPASLLTPHNRPFLRSRLIHRNWQRLTIPNLVRTVKGRGFGQVDLLYIDHPSQRFWLDEIEAHVSMTRIVDRYDGYSRVAPELLAMERDIVRSVDLVVHVSHVLEQHLRDMGARRTFYLPNGVDYAHFADGDASQPPEYERLGRPIALFVGSMESWFDFATINELTRSLPDVAFVLVGPDHLARREIAARPNVHILGSRPFDEVPRYMHNADVGLIPYDVHNEPERTHAVHPLKLYEYLACGLPVVAARWDEIERIGSPALLCGSTEDYANAIRRAISGSVDVAAGTELARRSSWAARVDALAVEVAAVNVEAT